jgi:hypothetical protein
VFWLEPTEADVLREFFQAERDAGLGRWRHPEHATFVVYEREGGNGGWLVLDELTGNTRHFAYRSHVDGSSSVFANVARAYFDAHPEPVPRLWENAKPGEVWVLTGAGGVEQPWRRDNGFWLSCTTGARKYDAERATAGRRIWPEGETTT